jgi:hypothetical protein
VHSNSNSNKSSDTLPTTATRRIENQGTAGGPNIYQSLACHSMGSTSITLGGHVVVHSIGGRASHAVAAFWRLAVPQKVAGESQTLWSK